MLRPWRMLMSIFDRTDRLRIHLLLASAAILGLLEVAGVASIMPFLAVVLNPGVIHTNRYLSAAFNHLGFTDTARFQVFLGVASLALLVINNALSALTAWFTQRFCYLRTHDLCTRLLDIYLRQPYARIMQRNRAELHKILVTDVDRVVIGTLMAGITLFSDLVATAFILAVLFAMNPMVSASTFAVLGLSYFVLWLTIRRPVARLGEEFPMLGNQIVARAQEALDGIKEIKVAARGEDFVRRLSGPRLQLARNAIRHGTLDLIPSRVIETTAFGVIIVVTLYLLMRTGNSGDAIAMVAFYAFAAYRLVPRLKSIFDNIDAVRYNAPALKIICADFAPTEQPPDLHGPDAIPLRTSIEIERVTFSYSGNRAPAARELSLVIPAGTFTCIVGPTGAGKSTAIDILLGLLRPEVGRVLVDGAELSPERPLASGYSVGYVPQFINLLDDTITNNIAFGLRPEAIDRERVRLAARQAQIHEFIENELENGYDGTIGEGGLRLSGGQRQRIGLARALYGDPQVLILDEATNGLDSRTESDLLDSLLALKPRRTIVCVSHRTTVAQRADRVLVLDAGRLVTSGTYAELSASGSPYQALLRAP